ncbi:DAO-domain-containing protein [Macrolepiota fuliginosa MF-IS2]|uniref:DAO-domain-containing protein n=1 Tax=Macrolepiota fuliginosa MF-IS2 TaxID=1400762 RepID=A0A9P6C2F5_9AGAR|nr:DAO-domain-containing protein [Macrolepiota fuliginosa MF-IS2]
MGASLSHVHHHVRVLLARAVLRILCLFSSPVRRLVNRLAVSPGIPISLPSHSYWINPASPIAKQGSGPNDPIPDYADIVIIGSGITGTSIARTILDHDAKITGTKRPLKVVMLEARDACSGATGRNGGHITPVLYQDYAQLKKQHGAQIAAQIIRFRLSHLTELLHVATEEDLLNESQCRRTLSYDVYQDTNLYRYAKDLLHTYIQDLPNEGADFRIIEDAEMLADLQLVPSVVGCLATSGGAIHPYRLVTGILTRLLRSYPSSFHIFTHTPCTNILASTSAHESLYTICTPKGNIRARHVIHATNAWASHLLPGMRTKIFPARAVMTAQLPRPGLGKTKSDWRGMRSFVLYPSSSFGCFDYLTQQLPAPDEQTPAAYPPSSAELMLGGGFMKHNAYLTEIGNADDSDWNQKVADYLSDAMGDYFRVGENDEREKVIAKWSGILAVSADERPWVGRVPESISLRGPVGKYRTDKFEPSPETIDSPLDEGEGSISLAPPGEWIAAGYSGEGMVHAWMSGKAVAQMVLELDRDMEWFPDVFRITQERYKEANVEEMLMLAMLASM